MLLDLLPPWPQQSIVHCFPPDGLRLTYIQQTVLSLSLSVRRELRNDLKGEGQAVEAQEAVSLSPGLRQGQWCVFLFGFSLPGWCLIRGNSHQGPAGHLYQTHPFVSLGLLRFCMRLCQRQPRPCPRSHRSSAQQTASC